MYILHISLRLPKNARIKELQLRKDMLSFALFLSVRISMISTILVFIVLVGFIFIKGIAYITPSLFEWEYTSDNVSMIPSMINTINMIIFSLAIAMPLGIFGAIFLTEYSSSKNRLIAIVTIASETLVGIPSIVYGLFGFFAFVLFFKASFSFLAGGLTLTIMILPVILRSSQEALKATPMSYREASFALGAGKLRTIFSVVLPAATPGILAGVILSIGKIVGESAALLYTFGTFTQVSGLFDSGRTLSVHMYVISSEGFHMNEAYSTAMILIIIVLCINVLSNYIAKALTKGNNG